MELLDLPPEIVGLVVACLKSRFLPCGKYVLSKRRVCVTLCTLITLASESTSNLQTTLEGSTRLGMYTVDASLASCMARLRFSAGGQAPGRV